MNEKTHSELAAVLASLPRAPMYESRADLELWHGLGAEFPDPLDDAPPRWGDHPPEKAPPGWIAGGVAVTREEWGADPAGTPDWWALSPEEWTALDEKSDEARSARLNALVDRAATGDEAAWRFICNAIASYTTEDPYGP